MYECSAFALRRFLAHSPRSPAGTQLNVRINFSSIGFDRPSSDEADCVILITVSIADERGARDKKPGLIVTTPVNWPANRRDKFVRSADRSLCTRNRGGERVSMGFNYCLTRDVSNRRRRGA